MLSPGDLLGVYTDGLTEAVNSQEEELGLDRLTAAVAGGREKPVREICDRVFGQVADWARDMPQYDDQTLLLLRRV